MGPEQGILKVIEIIIGDIMENEKPKTQITEATKQQLLRKPDIQPISDTISEALGEAYKAYVKFVGELETKDIQIDWRYYNDGKAWLAKGLYKWTGLRGGKNESTLFWLSIWEGFFKVTIYVPEKSRKEVLSLPIDDEAKQKIADSKQMGKQLKFFPVVFELRSDEMFEEIYKLIDFKKRIK